MKASEFIKTLKSDVKMIHCFKDFKTQAFTIEEFKKYIELPENDKDIEKIGYIDVMDYKVVILAFDKVNAEKLCEVFKGLHNISYT